MMDMTIIGIPRTSHVKRAEAQLVFGCCQSRVKKDASGDDVAGVECRDAERCQCVEGGCGADVDETEEKADKDREAEGVDR